MYYRSPKLADELIMDAARRPGLPSAREAIIAQNAAQQLGDTAYTESRGKGLSLGQERLKESGRQFNENLGLAKSQMKYNQGQSNIANLFALGGVGVSALGDYQSNKSFDQRTKIRNEIISDLENAGDEQSLFFAKLLKYQD